jgi:hypothetical protein
MNEQLKTQVLEAKEAFNQAVAAARAAGVAVNLWVTGTGPTAIEPSQVDLDFGISQG